MLETVFSETTAPRILVLVVAAVHIAGCRGISVLNSGTGRVVIGPPFDEESNSSEGVAGSYRTFEVLLVVARITYTHRALCPVTITPALGYPRLMELIFEIRDAEEGGLYARALGHAIFTEGETWEELRANVLEAVSLHFEDVAARPRLVQLHYVRDELIPVEAA